MKRTYHYRGYRISVALNPEPGPACGPLVRFHVWIEGECAAWTRDPWESTKRIIDYRIATRGKPYYETGPGFPYHGGYYPTILEEAK
jgi:hypothetical protein